MKRFFSLSRHAFLLALLALSGCGPYWVDPYITVKESNLNWVDIHYYNMRKKPFRRVRVYISGTGHVEISRGTSELVSDDFASKYAKSTWNDIRTSRVNISPEHAKDIFQHLVNYGLLDHEKFLKGTDKKEDKDITTVKRFIAVKANIDTNTYSKQENIFEVDPDLAEQLLDVIREFDAPQFR